MAGFFSQSEIQKKPSVTGKSLGCGKCGLNKNCKSPKINPYGKGKKKILIIGECPSEKEDNQNRYFIENHLKKELEKNGIDFENDCRKINAINCLPVDKNGKFENVTGEKIDCCRPMVWREIRRFQPKAILFLGINALGSFLGHRMNESLGGITKWRGWEIPDKETKCWVMPIDYISSYVYEEDELARIIFQQDVERFCKLHKKPFPKMEDEKKKIKIITKEKNIIDFLTGLIKQSKKDEFIISFDYETTSLKPYMEKQKIVCCSIGLPDDTAVTFPTDSKKVLRCLGNVLSNQRIKKIAANMKFEHNWTREKIGVEVQGWYWDTMLAGHQIDSRRGICGLDFQTYISFGLLDYSSHIKPFLRSKGGANSMNRIEQIDKRDLYLYCGLDSYFERKLAFKQMDELLFYGKE